MVQKCTWRFLGNTAKVPGTLDKKPKLEPSCLGSKNHELPGAEIELLDDAIPAFATRSASRPPSLQSLVRSPMPTR
jgi:hypothetical protein